MNKKMSKRQKDIKSKLMAAICMLLVSSIMMVSTTYAWFTLSTAPEVTGINTAVGANGNLEMALLPANGDPNAITSGSGDGAETKAITEKNVTWGNLVDLGSTEVAQNAYGLNKITLYPSELNVADGKIPLLAGPLKTPVYGADGRVKEVAENTSTATYADGKFNANSDKGVRAVGVSSGMTQRELDYRNALSAANTAMGSAATKAKLALELNGGTLASIAVKHGTDDNATFAKADVQALGAMITSLEESMKQIDNAYKSYILAFAASNMNTNEAAYTLVKGFVDTADSTTATVLTGIGTLAGDDALSAAVPDYINTGITKYNTTAANVAAAKATYKTNVTDANKDEYEWDDISAVVNALANSSDMKVNGFTMSEIIADKQKLVDSYLGTNKLTVTVGTGAGVFADVADQCGDYKANVFITGVTVEGLTLNNVKAMMETKTEVNPPYLVAAGNALTGKAPAAGNSEEKTLSEMYGYIIDMAFRTNAAESDLQLQVDAVDRIYSDQTGAETMGHGSSMTFEATTADLDQTQVKALMDAIRIVFFDPADGTIIANAKLDAANAESTIDGLTAKMYLYTTEAGVEQYKSLSTGDTIETGVDYYTETTTVTFVEATTVTAENFATSTGLYTKTGAGNTESDYTAVNKETDVFGADTTYYTKNSVKTYNKVDDPSAVTDVTTLYVKELTGAGENKLTDNKIMGLTQNTATALSVLVYLDGTQVSNGDVAATGSTSMTGTMNLQFSSSATLVPMEYRALHQGTVTETTEATTTPASSESSGT